jgi:hypothetical protein
VIVGGKELLATPTAVQFVVPKLTVVVTELVAHDAFASVTPPIIIAQRAIPNTSSLVIFPLSSMRNPCNCFLNFGKIFLRDSFIN